MLADRENMLVLVGHGIPHRVCAGKYSKLGHARALERAIDCMEATKKVDSGTCLGLRCNQRKTLESDSLYHTVLLLRGIPDNASSHFPLFQRSKDPVTNRRYRQSRDLLCFNLI